MWLSLSIIDSLFCWIKLYTWWHHQIDTFFALLAICAENSPVTDEFPKQRPVTRSFDVSLICARINGWVTNREAGDLRRHSTHYCNKSLHILGNRTHDVEKANIYGSDIDRFGHTVLTREMRPTHGKSSLYGWDLHTYGKRAQVIYRLFVLQGRHRGNHDDVIKWKKFPRNWPFVRGIHRSRWIPHTKASDEELWCFLWSASE